MFKILTRSYLLVVCYKLEGNLVCRAWKSEANVAVHEAWSVIICKENGKLPFWTVRTVEAADIFERFGMNHGGNFHAVA